MAPALMKMLYLIAAFIIILLVTTFLKRSKDKPQALEQPPDTPQADLYLAPAGESAERAGRALPSEGSEDVSHLLGTFDTPVPDYLSEEDRDYQPEEETEWVVTATFEDSTTFTPQQIKSVFNDDWDQKYGDPTLYGFDPKTKRWTYVFSADSPSHFTSLKLAWDYYTSWNEAPLATEQNYKSRLDAVKTQLSPFHPTSVSATKAPADAAIRAKDLKSAHSKLSQDAFILLQAPSDAHFDGRDIWDTMLCLGLRWGDMDLFHWNNHGTTGDDAYFSVWTSTSPGYFFPELIAADKVKTADLAFGFSIPRSADPEKIFKSMYEAAQYSQKRLGGTLIGKDGAPLDFDRENEHLLSVVRELNELGFKPGQSNTLHLF